MRLSHSKVGYGWGYDSLESGYNPNRIWEVTNALTDTAIRRTKPRQRPFKVYDRDGLFLMVNPGGSKLWRWRYRIEGKAHGVGENPQHGFLGKWTNVSD